MPWISNMANNNSGGPWGQRPPNGGGPFGGGNSGGQRPPDFEDLIRRGQDRMRQAMPGGVGGPTLLLAGLILLTIIGIFTSVYQVQPSERGVVLRFGQYLRTDIPGLNWHLPFGIDRHYRVKVEENQQTNIGFTMARNGRGQNEVVAESLMLTGDENIVNIQFTVNWRIKPDTPTETEEGISSGARNYLFNVDRPDETLKAVAESAMREVVGRNNFEPIITQGRAIVEDETRDLIQTTLDAYNSGILVTQVQLQDADPPDQVVEAFRDVVAAQQEKEQLKNKANQYTNKVVPEARGDAKQILLQAEAYRTETVLDAIGRAVRFNQIYEEYSKAKNVTRERMFLETMERVLANKNKVLVDGDGAGVVPYLPLPELQKQTQREGSSQ